MSGEGVYRWSDGRQYKGQYKNGLKDGFGEYVWVDGRIYTGEWKDGKRHGVGILIYPNRKVCKGRWEAGEKIEPMDMSPAEIEKTLVEHEFPKIKEDDHERKSRSMVYSFYRSSPSYNS